LRGSSKIVAGQQYPERMAETLAELPFIGDQITLFRGNQAARSVE